MADRPTETAWRRERQLVAPQLPLAGQIALVTGGSRGIGAAIAVELARAGAEVAINYRSNVGAATAVANAAGGRASIWQADVTDLEAATELVGSVRERHGGLDCVVANAGVWRGGR